jgi:hypothetical protein
LKASIVIPIYKSTLDSFELKSLVQCKKIFFKHPIIFVSPFELDINLFKNIIPEASYEYFDACFFKDISGYNNLLLSPQFYKRIKTDYLLIYQLDAWVFKDDLIEWCNKGFDYIGAPYSYKGLSLAESQDLKSGEYVLNGGLSLRNTKACLRAAKIYQLFFSNYKGNEDAYFSGCFSRFFFIKYILSLPDFKTALKFAMEKEPNLAYKLNNDQLPFGCHAFRKYEPYFWEKHGII